MSTLDIVITIGYLVTIVTFGTVIGLRSRRRAKGGASEYFLAGNRLTWPVIGMALFATNISCVHLVTLAQAGYTEGLLQGNFEWMAAFTLVLLSLFFAPFYIRSHVTTLPDFLEKRYSRECRDWLAIISMVSAITIHIGFSFLTGAIVLKALFGISAGVTIVVLALACVTYTIIGGLMAVVFTETVETVVLLGGAILITIFALMKTGGTAGVTAVLETAKEAKMMSVMHQLGDSSGMSWLAIFLGYPVLGIWYWCAEQTIVQRVLGARDENHARVGPLFAGLIKILPVFLFVFPGLVFFAAIKGGQVDNVVQLRLQEKLDQGALVVQLTGAVRPADGAAPRVVLRERFVIPSGQPLDVAGALRQAGADPAGVTLLTDEKLDGEAGRAYLVPAESGLRHEISKGTYTVMIRNLLPKGLRGIVAAALIAALMSTVSGALNSLATLFSYDLYKRFRPQTDDRRLVAVGRVAAFVSMLVAIGLVPLLNSYESLFRGLNDIIAHFAPPVTAVFLLGVFWPRASATGAKWTLWIGSATGVLVFALNKLSRLEAMAPFVPDFIARTPFMMMTFYLLVYCLAILVGVSLLAPKRPEEDPERLYWPRPLDSLKFRGWGGLGSYKVLAALLVVIMALLYAKFFDPLDYRGKEKAEAAARATPADFAPAEPG